MFKKKPLFITFEGIEGSGKSFQSLKLYKNLKKKNIYPIFTREPGGSVGAELIRKLILSGEKKKFSRITDTLLYLASRNEHIENTIIPAIKKNKIIICDRFYDSTYAYQVFGHKVNNKMIKEVHKIILKKIKPHLTFILKVKLKKSSERIKKRKKLNRYDKFSKTFYSDVQKGFLKLALEDQKRCVIIDNSNDSNDVEKIILNKVLKKLSV